MLFLNPEKLQAQQDELRRQTPVILMGRGHSGTRVLSWICTHLGLQLGTSATLATGDADDQKFTQAIKKITLNHIGSLEQDAISQKDLFRFQNAVAGYYTRLQRPDALWGWKFPETYLIASFIAATFPHARYIHLVRDGRDIAFKRHLTDDPKRKLGRKILASQNALALPHHLQAAISWAYQVNNFDQFRQGVAPERILDVTFEDICQQPHETTARISAFLDLPFTEKCRTYLDEQIDRSKVGQYQENDPQLIQEVETRIESTLKRYHYL